MLAADPLERPAPAAAIAAVARLAEAFAEAVVAPVEEP